MQLEIENLQLQTACSGYLKDIHDLKISLKKADQNLSDLTGKLAMKEQNDQVIDELMKKAKQFEEFMRNQSPTKSALLTTVVNGQANRFRDQCVSTEDLFVAEVPQCDSSNSSSQDRSHEKRIREGFARATVTSLSEIEVSFKTKLLECEQKVSELTGEVSTLQALLKEREIDISNLKKCILKERYEIKFILEQKDAELAAHLNKHQNQLAATCEELNDARKRIKTLLDEQNQCRKEFQAERESMNKLMHQRKMELNALIEREEILTEQIKRMESEHKATLQNLNEKYSTARKTVSNYKMYMDDKEKHIERESERLRSTYQMAMEKMKDNMKTSIREAEKQANKRIAELQAKLDAALQNKR